METILTGFSQTVFTLSLIVINLALFFRWITLRPETRRYRGVGLVFVAFALIAQLPIFLQSSGEFIGLVIAMAALGLFKIYLTTAVGLHFAQALQLPYFRPGGITPTVRTPITHILVPKPKGWFLAVFFSLAFMLAISILLFRFYEARPIDIGLNNPSAASPSPALLVVTLFVIAFTEEIIFRLGLQNWLSYSWGHSKRSQWLAILLTTTIWTLGHAGMIEPGWVKFAQMFIMGILLGLLNQRFGVLSCIAVHGLFNVFVTLNHDWFSHQL